jgi:ATP-dependent DNA helicase Rep
VLAGAGSGKTRVITHKIADLCRRDPPVEGSVFAVTFTNKAAREMRERAARLLSADQLERVSVSTFHSLGMRMLREDAQSLGLQRNFSVFDTRDCEALLQQLSAERGIEVADCSLLRWRISQWKNDLIDPAAALAAAGETAHVAAAQMYARFCDALQTYNAVDFDDLVLRAVALLREHPEVREKWRRRVAYLLVDEYQDTNNVQYALVRELLGERAVLTVVGDDDQSIYAWRGARPQNLQRLAEDYPPLQVIKLEQNYRSTGRILRCANRLIGHNPHIFEKSLWSELGPGEKLRVLNCNDADDEAERVSIEIVGHKFRQRTRFSDYAILYRGNHQSRAVERALRAHNVPYSVSGGTAFFDRSEIKDLLAYLRLLANPYDDTAFLRIVNTPRREIGPTAIERLSGFARRRHLSLLHASVEQDLRSEAGARIADHVAGFGHWIVLLADNAQRGDPLANIRQMLEDCRYFDWLHSSSASSRAAEMRVENVNELLDWLHKIGADGERSLAEIVAQITVLDMLDRDQESDNDAVQLMTLHAAKGLEFPYVFIVGMEESLLPHHNSLEDEALEEERRLAYVGVTRARRELTFTCTTHRVRHGERIACVPSRFLGEMPSEDLAWEGREASSAEERQAHGKSQLAGLRALLSE